MTIVLVLVLLAPGCRASSDPPADATTPTLQVADPSTDEAPTIADANDPAIQADPEQALAVAMADLGKTYRFDSTIETQPGDRVTVTGYRIDDATSYEIGVAGEMVRVVMIADQTWVLDANTGEWLPTDSTPSSGDPITALAEPSNLTADNTGSIIASYPASTFSAGADGTVEVEIMITRGALTFVSTQGPLRMQTTLTAGDTLPPILAPA